MIINLISHLIPLRRIKGVKNLIMKIHKEGYLLLTISFIILIALNHFIISHLPMGWKWLLFSLSILFWFFLLRFFRVPARVITPDATKVLSPADGKVVVIENVFEAEYFKSNRIQISVFMSPLNVHINRFPVGGQVILCLHHPGKYLVAWHPKSSVENEHTTVVVKVSGGADILFRQIAGAVARRIKCYCKEGDVAKQGDEMGFIKFGSRVDIFLPLDAVIKVKINDKVIGGETVLALLAQ